MKEVIGKLSKMRYEMMTNKPLGRVEDDLPDAEVWNNYFNQVTQQHG